MAFGGLTCVDKLDIHVDEGEIVSVIGPNGAGKTTLFNLVTGVYEPTGGDIVFEGESIKGLTPHKITQRGIARTFQTLRLFLNMSVRENVMAAAYGHTKRRGVPVDVAHARACGARSARSASWPRSASRSSATASWATAGTSPRTASRTPIAAGSRSPARPPRTRGCSCSTSLPPDEPEGDAGDHGADRASCAIEGGYTILVIEHDMHVVEGISDRVIALDHGVKIAEGTFEQVATNPRVVEAYLGTGADGAQVSTGNGAGPSCSSRGSTPTTARSTSSPDSNLYVREGELVCLLGGNASGKSTTLKTILGLVRPRTGPCAFAGEDVTERAHVASDQAWPRDRPREPPSVRADDGAREPRDGLVPAAEGGSEARSSSASTRSSRCSTSAARSSRGRSRAASSRWSRWVAR